MEDQNPLANNTRDTECTRIPITEDEVEDHHQYFDGRQIHRVPQVMRFKKHNEEDLYAPKIVSIGPYYHGLPELGMAEELKHKVLTDFVSCSGKDREFFYCQIFKVIDQIRNCYVGVSRDAYDDGELAEIMLLDASFAIYLMKVFVSDKEKYDHFCQHLGMALLTFAFQDMLLLENQIPLCVIKLLTKLIYGKREEGHMLICDFISNATFGVSRLKIIPGEDRRQPLHLLDATHRIFVKELDNTGEELVEELDNAGEERVEELDNTGEELVEDSVNAEKRPVSKCLWWPWRKQNQNEFENYNRQFRSVTDLKAKGIHFKPSSYCLKNIKFKSYKFYGQLELPVWLFTINSKPYFTQMIAYEASPESNADSIIICYVNFLKSLIIKPEDVKELREKKILFSTLDSDEQIVKLIKQIDNYGLEDDWIFYDVKKGIEKHCSSKAKTWFAELINTHFRSPWTLIALFAATFLLCLTFLQTYYTMNLPK
ncbi:Hypothetical predicted protein [Olea europaea subsp. europaea]|uniref:Uncharacterized protein n=1 Tax=Olea europaea subsp. europaea TaxID=158383 RepID=A0A8S0R9H0_OLEEU|nr:Hypothetical predicted protein [Olea europaea subsp. europaea]